ncbi:hypothetical protein [Roseateles sp.]|uniref:hypothetical protein n=1 Tax=Roseateles sp. TaxID=1971397 RepID=UPI00326782D7
MAGRRAGCNVQTLSWRRFKPVRAAHHGMNAFDTPVPKGYTDCLALAVGTQKEAA